MENEKKKPESKISGWIFILLGVITISLRFLNLNNGLNAVDIAKLVLGIACLGYGFYKLISGAKKK